MHIFQVSSLPSLFPVSSGIYPSWYPPMWNIIHPEGRFPSTQNIFHPEWKISIHVEHYPSWRKNSIHTEHFPSWMEDIHPVRTMISILHGTHPPRWNTSTLMEDFHPTRTYPSSRNFSILISILIESQPELINFQTRNSPLPDFLWDLSEGKVVLGRRGPQQPAANQAPCPMHNTYPKSPPISPLETSSSEDKYLTITAILQRSGRALGVALLHINVSDKLWNVVLNPRF